MTLEFRELAANLSDITAQLGEGRTHLITQVACSAEEAIELVVLSDRRSLTV